MLIESNLVLARLVLQIKSWPYQLPTTLTYSFSSPAHTYFFLPLFDFMIEVLVCIVVILLGEALGENYFLFLRPEPVTAGLHRKNWTINPQPS